MTIMTTMSNTWPIEWSEEGWNRIGRRQRPHVDVLDGRSDGTDDAAPVSGMKVIEQSLVALFICFIFLTAEADNGHLLRNMRHKLEVVLNYEAPLIPALLDENVVFIVLT